MTRTWSAVLLCSTVVAIAAPAFAQDAAPADGGFSMFDRGRNVSVAERPHPGYDPIPVPMGSFTALPALTAGVEFNDNIYSQNNNKRSDTIFNVAPSLNIASRWSSNAVNLFVRSGSRFYTRTSTENTTDVQGGASGRLDFAARGNAAFGADVGVLHEPRSSPSAPLIASRPVEYNAANVFASVQQEFSRVRLGGRVDYQNLDYKNAVDSRGATVLQDDRDHTTTTLGGKAEYAISPAIAVYAAGSYNDHHYRLSPPAVAQNRSSTGNEFDFGTSFDLTAVARGSAQIGYVNQKYASRFGTISGLTAFGSLEWFPTELTTVTISGSRAIQDSSALNSAAFIAEGFSLQADHELMRNIILSARGGYETDKYQGISRTDQQTNASVSAKYLLNRLVGVGVSYNYAKLNSTGTNAGARYTDNKFLVSTTLQF